MSVDTADGKETEDVIRFTDSPFAQSLIPHINLIGITDGNIQKLCPSQSTASWVNLGFNEQDVEDAAYLLLDNHTKLLRCGGLHGDKYVDTVSICNLTQNESINDMNDDNESIQSKIEWVSLPRMTHRRHGHQILCVELDQSPHIMAIGGFDSKGNTLKLSEIISVDRIQNHIRHSLRNQKKQNDPNHDSQYVI